MSKHLHILYREMHMPLFACVDVCVLEIGDAYGCFLVGEWQVRGERSSTKGQSKVRSGATASQ